MMLFNSFNKFKTVSLMKYSPVLKQSNKTFNKMGSYRFFGNIPTTPKTPGVKENNLFILYNFFKYINQNQKLTSFKKLEDSILEEEDVIRPKINYKTMKEHHNSSELEKIRSTLKDYLTLSPTAFMKIYKDSDFIKYLNNQETFQKKASYESELLSFSTKLNNELNPITASTNAADDSDEAFNLIKMNCSVNKIPSDSVWEENFPHFEYDFIQEIKGRLFIVNVGMSFSAMYDSNANVDSMKWGLVDQYRTDLFLDFISPHYDALEAELNMLKDKLPFEMHTKDFKPLRKASVQKNNFNNLFVQNDIMNKPNVKVIEIKFNFIKYFLGFLLLSFIFSMMGTTSKPGEDKTLITFQQFKNDFLAKNYVERLFVYNKDYVEIKLTPTGMSSLDTSMGNYRFVIGDIDIFEKNLEAIQDDMNIAPNMRVPVVYFNKAVTLRDIFINWGPTLLMAGGMIYLLSKGAKSLKLKGLVPGGEKKKFEEILNVETKFKDVAGCDEAKQEIMEFVHFLREPAKYEKLGARLPRGAILSGPPGTGKTLLAKATAGEAGVPFYSVSGAEFVEMFVGMGASRVRELFTTARKNAPSIIFIDEIDAIGKARGSSGGNDEREATLNQILVELDGFKSDDHVVVLAGTNRADLLDKALTRPGRFDRHVTVDNPEFHGRKQLFELYLKKVKYDTQIDSLVDRLAALTAGFSGADISNCCNEAALFAARDKSSSITLKHFEQAIDRTIAGLERKTKLLTPEEKKIVAYHEAGHAICGWYLREADPLLKVSIIPRSQGVLGFAQYVPGDKYLMNNNEFTDKITQLLGGRVSEELHFDSVTGGAHDDIKKITNLARSMVAQLGMSKKVGWAFYGKDQNSSDYTKPFSEETAELIDKEVKRIVDECYTSCKNLLTEKAQEVEIIAQELLKNEVLSRDDLVRLLGKRPFPEKNMDYINSIGEGKKD
ncbi:hypothetical protein ACO0R3_001669 [Hanseniaspora guilliermondii]